MLEYATGDILKSTASTIVIPVNCMGVMGAGLARQFRDKFPVEAGKYVTACAMGKIQKGDVFFIESSDRHFVMFPTKVHWRFDSSYEWIEDGLKSLSKQIHLLDVMSLAIPKLGCGLGNLEWELVKPLIEEMSELWATRRCYIHVYVSKGDLE